MEKGLKQKVVKVKTAYGERQLKFTVEERTINGICCDFCKYCGICEKLPHPEYLDDESRSFIDFCNFCITDEEGDSFGKSWIPVPGTIEENLADICDPYKRLATKKGNLYVPLNKVIDTACAGICADYTEDHSKCNCSNQFCLLRDLFTKEEPQESDIEVKKEENNKENNE